MAALEPAVADAMASILNRNDQVFIRAACRLAQDEKVWEAGDFTAPEHDRLADELDALCEEATAANLPHTATALSIAAERHREAAR